MPATLVSMRVEAHRDVARLARRRCPRRRCRARAGLDQDAVAVDGEHRVARSLRRRAAVADDVAERDALGAGDEDAVAVPVHDLEALEQQVVEVRGEDAAGAVGRVAAGSRAHEARPVVGGAAAADELEALLLEGRRARGSRRTRSGAWRRPPRRSPRSRWRRRRARRSCRPRRTAAPRSRPRCGSPGRRGRTPSSPAVVGAVAGEHRREPGARARAALARDLAPPRVPSSLPSFWAVFGVAREHEVAALVRAEADRREVARACPP